MGRFRFIKVLAAVMVAASVVWGQTWNIGTGGGASNVTATLANGTLTISGTGTMQNFSHISGRTTAPWGERLELLTAVFIEDGVTNIGSSAFRGCTGLTSVTIPNSVISIGFFAFDGCTGLTTLNFNAVNAEPNFSGGNNLTTLNIGNQVEVIPTGFYYIFSLMSINVDSRNPAFSSEDGVLFNKAKTTLILYPASKGGDYIIPNSVTTIGNQAFNGCTGLTSVTIPNSVTTIGNQAFNGCTGLTSVTIPNSVTTIGDGAFNGCTGLTSVTIPNSVTTIGDWAFWDCTGLTSVTIPNSVTTIGDWAFGNCTGLTSVTIPNSVTTIGREAFYGCTGLTSVTIPNSVTTIGREAFYGCTGLTSINVNSGNPFFSSEDGVLFDNAKTVLLQYPSGKQGDYVIPNSVTTIGSSAFRGCTGLTSVTIPNSVTTIGNSAFRGCTGLTSVTIGNSVTTIENGAFRGCISLTEIVNYASTPQVINPNVFTGVQTNNIRLLVPNRAVNAYKAAEVWQDFDIAGFSTCNYNWFHNADASWYFMAETEFIITTPEQLAGLALIVNEGGVDFSGKTVRLGNNISLNNTNNWQNWATLTPSDLICWTSIGTSENPFRGTFDGNGFVVSGIYIDAAGDNQGLFGVVEDGKIEKLGIVASRIWGETNVGGLAGKTNRSTIEYCFSMANVAGNSDIGGLIGNSNSAIMQCYATGNITGETNVGGLIGNRAGGTITSSFFNLETLGGGDNGAGRTAAQMRTQSTYLGWDFREEVGIWKINSEINDGFPYIVGYHTTSIRNRNRQTIDSRHGIILDPAIATEFAKISVKTPEQAQITLRILDNLGNVVFTETAVGANHHLPIVWDLRNQAGRLVANGMYLIIVEATGISGRRYLYSSRIGVNR